MSTKSISKLEATVAFLEARMKLMEEQMGRMEEMVEGGEAVKSEPKKKRKSGPSSEKMKKWREFVSNVTKMVSEESKTNLKVLGFNHMKVAGYLKDKIDGDPTQKDVDKAVKYLLDNPDYQSNTDKIRSEKSSVADKSDTEAPKKGRGRPKKAVVASESDDEEKVEKKKPGRRGPCTPSLLPPKKFEVVTVSDDDGNEEAEEWSWKGKNYYKLKKTNTVLDEDFEYVGVFNGKEIDEEVAMPATAKKYIEDNLA